jgi:hypothetical protein
MQEAGDHSRYAKADCHRKCPSTGSAKMGRISSLTNTDTQRNCVSTAGQWDEWLFSFVIWDYFFHKLIHLNYWSEILRPPLPKA